MEGSRQEGRGPHSRLFQLHLRLETSPEFLTSGFLPPRPRGAKALRVPGPGGGGFVPCLQRSDSQPSVWFNDHFPFPGELGPPANKSLEIARG